MAEIQQGAQVIPFGAPSLTLTINGGSALPFSGTSCIVLSDLQHERTADVVDTRDAAGNVVNSTHFNPGNKVTLTVKPAGSTAANAKTVNDAFPKPGGYAILIDGTNTTYLDNVAKSGTVGGVSITSTGVPYQIESASKNTSGGNPVTWTLGLRQLDSITSWTPLS